MAHSTQPDKPIYPNVAPIFIVGTGRSGTTLLYSMLNAHPRIALTNELRFFGELIKVRDHVPQLRDRNDIGAVFDLLKARTQEFKYLANIDQVEADVVARWETLDDHSYARFFLCLLEAYAQIHNAARYGDKSPIEIRSLEQILTVFPNARVIELVRDPRAVVASRLKMSWTSNDVIVNALKWKIDRMYVQSYRDRHPQHPGLLAVRYEDLVTSPEQELRRVCAFIGERYVPEMLSFEQHASAYTRRSGESFTQTFKPLSQASLDRWRTELSAEKILIIELLTRDMLQSLGYKQSVMRWTTRMRMPFVFLVESLKYIVYKSAEIRARRKRSDPLIIGDSASLYRKLFDALRR